VSACVRACVYYNCISPKVPRSTRLVFRFLGWDHKLQVNRYFGLCISKNGG